MVMVVQAYVGICSAFLSLVSLHTIFPQVLRHSVHSEPIVNTGGVWFCISLGILSYILTDCI